MMSDTDAREIVERAAWRVTGTELAPRSLDLVQAVSRFETAYGSTWPPAGKDSHNWGAVQVGGKYATLDEAIAACPARGGFGAKDHDATGKEYFTCFKSYASDDDGAASVIGTLWKRPTTRGYLLSGEGDPTDMAIAMKRAKYYEGPTARYAAALRRHVTAIRAALGREASRLAPAIGLGAAVVAGGLAVWRFVRVA